MGHCKYKMLGVAISMAATEHEGQFDKSGKPYILHCLQVMNDVESKDPEVMQVAVMHDLMEDTCITPSILFEEGFSYNVIESLVNLKHEKRHSYEEYIDIICTDRVAMLVKMADLRHNSQITRLEGVTEKDTARMVKYYKAYTKIRAKLKQLGV